MKGRVDDFGKRVNGYHRITVSHHRMKGRVDDFGNRVNGYHRINFDGEGTRISAWQREHCICDATVSEQGNVEGLEYEIGGKQLWVAKHDPKFASPPGLASR
eukprot:gene21445-biopygen1806